MEAAATTKPDTKTKTSSGAEPSARVESGPELSAGSPQGMSPFLQRVALAPSAPMQAKLTVNQPGDAHEQQADHIADTVMRKPAASPEDGKLSKPFESGSGDATDSVSPLPAHVRRRVEPLLGADLGQVRVHSGPAASEAARSLHAKAFTHRNDIWLGPDQDAGDVSLMAHEATHVVQQGSATGAIQRQEEDARPAAPSDTPTAAARNQSFGFSEDEMERRLSSTPARGADVSSTSIERNSSTESRLGGLRREGRRGEGEERGREGRGSERGDRRVSQRTVGEREERGSRGRGRSRELEGREGPPETPGPASEFEGLLTDAAGAYMEGNLSDERLAAIGPRTEELLAAADLLGDRSITDPEASALEGLASGLQPGESPTGYEGEPLWLRTLARIRDITGQLGGIVGIIGLVATVSGFILSFLIPPVGAFLLTVGRFCDIAALILDAISLVLGIILTGYNLYRLKNETNPEERRRLLGMVRQDAMGTVMSAVAVATAVAPGAARVLGRSRVGRFAGRVVRAGGERVAGAAARLAASPTRLGRAAATIGRVGAAGVGLARRAGRSVSGRFHTFMGRVRDYGLRTALGSTAAGRLVRRIGTTAVGRGIGRGLGAVGRSVRAIARSAPGRLIGRGAAAGFGHVRRGAAWLGRSRAGRMIAESRFGRWASRTYGENLNLARVLFEGSERAHHTYVGAGMRAELAAAQRGGALPSAAAARPALAARLPAADFPEVDLRNLALRSDPTSGNLVFGRPGARTSTALVPGRPGLQNFLDNIRRTEASAINDIVANNPGITDAAIAARLNARPGAPARWTENEIWSFRMQPNTSIVLKTPHHTLSVLDAPHLAYDPRYIQLANAPLVVPRGTTRATSPWAAFSTRAARRPPTAAAAALDVPFVRRTGDAEGFARGTSVFGDGRPLTPPPSGAWDPAFFRSEEFFEGLRRQGNTGVWVNPHDPTQRLLFDAHIVAGHRWVTGEAGARAIFGPSVDAAGRFEGAVGRTLGDRTVGAFGRLAARDEDNWPTAEEGAGSERAPIPADDRLDGLEEPASRFSAEEAASGAGAPPGLPLFMMGADSAGAGGALEGEGPEPPPSPVIYSPGSLVSIREQRTVIAEAIAAVNEYIGETHEAEAHNQAARDTATALKDRNVEQREFAEGERNTVAGEQDKLTQAGSAKDNMAAENARATSESDRGKSEGDTVRSEGQNVSVEPKAEEPESRSWLERAWDATVGAAWDALIAPAIRLVKRKVKEVMESINEFIMNMINQALGLDEIEAELNGGGEDIANRSANLRETDTGLRQTQDQATQEEQRNQTSIDQAAVNIGETRDTREEAQTVLTDLRAHDEALQAEESAGQAYVVDFGARYQPFFEQQPDADAMASESPVENPIAPPVEGEGTDETALV